MDVVFKAINNKTYPYNVNPDDSIGSVIDRLHVDSGTSKETHTFKIIYQGKILSMEQKFSEFTPVNPKDKLMFVFMAGKNKPVTTEQPKPQQQTQPAPAQNPVQTPIQSPPVTVHTQPMPAPTTFTQSIFTNPDDGYEEAMGEMDETDKLRAALIGTLVFVRAQPQMMELFNNNFEAFAQIIMSPQFKPMFQAMLNDMAAGDEQLDNFTDSVVSHGNNSGPDQTQTVSLTQEDMGNIATLEALGFDRQACVQAYILANKNLDMAASMLMDM